MPSMEKLTDTLWEIPKDEQKHMRVPARIFASDKIMNMAMSDNSLQQLMNVASLPGIQRFSLVMPDIHEGYGFPIGGVAAIDFETGVISPGGIGYDINCGVRMLKSELDQAEIQKYMETLAKEFYGNIPSGVGKGGALKLNQNELDKVLNYGVKWAVSEGYATEEDRDNIESRGSLNQANASAVSDLAKKRGNNQIGTMGAGNHFVEIDVVDEIFDEKAAEIYGLKKGQVVVQIHTGSRGLGHQIATDYIKQMMSAIKSFGYDLPDRELVCAPLRSPLGTDYLAAMSAAANYAWTNRQMITCEARNAWKNILGDSGGSLEILYDVAHNIAKVEEHDIDGRKKKVVVHRKGATRAFPAAHPEVPEKYRSIGQPVLIPGSMGTSSYVLSGQPAAMEQSFGSTCHGAGRTMSRTKARKSIHGKTLLEELKRMGIVIQAGSFKGLAEEAPNAYKDVESVVDVVDRAGIAKKVVKVKPLAVIKG